MPRHKSKRNLAVDPQDDVPVAVPGDEVPAEVASEDSERMRWELLCDEAGLPEIGEVPDPAKMFAFATRELAILARLSPDLHIKLVASQFLFREFNSRPPGGLTEKEEFILKLKREVERVAIEVDGGEALDLAIEASGTARLPGLPAGQNQTAKGESS
jgi:hypothetical protein